MKAFIFKYSAKTGLTKLIDASRVSEAEYSALEQNTKWLQLQKEPSLTLWLFFSPFPYACYERGMNYSLQKRNSKL